MNKLVVTRHKSLIELLEKRGIITPETPRIGHTDDWSEIEGKDLIGVVPPKIAIRANSVLEVPMKIPPEWRKVKVDERGDATEIPLELLETFAGEERIYKVQQIETRTDFSEAIVITPSGTFLQYLVREHLIARRGPQHIEAATRMQRAKEGLQPLVTAQEIEGKAVIGHLSYHMAALAQDVTNFDLRYEFEKRGMVHSYEDMKKFDNGTLTYTVTVL
jgi:hypothetical protein